MEWFVFGVGQKSNKEIVMKAVKSKGMAIAFASDSLKNDVIKLCHQDMGEVEQGAQPKA